MHPVRVDKIDPYQNVGRELKFQTDSIMHGKLLREFRRSSQCMICGFFESTILGLSHQHISFLRESQKQSPSFIAVATSCCRLEYFLHSFS